MGQSRHALALALLAASCGRIGFDAGNGTGADSGVFGLGEDLQLPPGWTAEVWVDFSADFTFVDVQYLDTIYPMNNRPHHMVLLSAPFDPGIALVATWELFEVRAPDVFTPHSYYPGVDDGPGPDALFDAVFCDVWMGPGPGICVAAGSQNGGDGVFRVEADWSIQKISSDNNVGDIAYDPTGAFDGVGAPTIFWAGPDGLRRFGGNVFYPGMLNGAFTEVLPTGDLLTMHTDDTSGTRRLVIVESNTHAEITVRSTTETFEPVARQHAGAFAVVAGDTTRLPGLGYAIAGTRELLEVMPGGGSSVIATAGAGWRWTHAIIPPADHPLGADGWTLYLLEYAPATEINRIIRLRPP